MSGQRGALRVRIGEIYFIYFVILVCHNHLVTAATLSQRFTAGSQSWDVEEAWRSLLYSLLRKGIGDSGYSQMLSADPGASVCVSQRLTVCTEVTSGLQYKNYFYYCCLNCHFTLPELTFNLSLSSEVPQKQSCLFA